jgi:Ca2+/Na+ antiporter
VPKKQARRPATPRLRLVIIGLVGLAALVLGGDIFVRGAVGLAAAVGMSERVVGLTIVAVGTSLPELAASLVAAFRGHSDMAVGNIVGSNVFNVLLILGAAAILTPSKRRSPRSTSTSVRSVCSRSSPPSRCAPRAS